MFIIKPSEFNIQKIVALMLNFEHQSTIFNEDLTKKDINTPFPIIPIDNINVHYGATSGIIFYNASLNFNLSAFIEEIIKCISPFDTHLISTKIALSTSSSIIKQERVIPGTHFGKYPFFKKTIKTETPARLFIQNKEITLPPYYSARASFTWYFMPISTILNIHEFENLNEVNAMISSIFYDASNLCKLDGLVYCLSVEDFNIEYLPKLTEDVALLIDIQNNLTIIDNYRSLYYPKINLSEKKWEDVKDIIPYHNCFNCNCKFIQECILVNVDDILNVSLDLLDSNILLCTYCWNKCSVNIGYKINDFVNLDYAIFTNSKVEEIVQGVYKFNNIILVAENLGTFPALTIPEIANLNLPIMNKLKIIIEN